MSSDVSSGAAPRLPVRPRRPLGPGIWALVLAALIVLASLLAFIVDMGSAQKAPLELQLWAVHPFVIVVAMAVALLAPLTLAVVAIRTRRETEFGIGALVVAGVPELVALATVALVVGNAVT